MSKSKKKILPPDVNPLHPDKKMVTRRDFIASSATAFSAGLFMPSVIDLALGNKLAQAQSAGCASGPTGPAMLPFLIFDCAGGAALCGNWVMGGTEGTQSQFTNLPSYSYLGLDATSSFVTDFRFGAPMAAGFAPAIPIDPVTGLPNRPMHPSRIFDSLDLLLPANVQANLRMGTIPCTSLSDSGVNQFSAVSMVAKAGLSGGRLKSGLGLNQTLSAGNSEAASMDFAYRPLTVQSVDSLTTALGYGPAFNGLPQAVREGVARLITRLSAGQSRRLASMTLGQQFSTLAECGYAKNITYASGSTPPVDARLDPVFQNIYGINGGTGANSMNAVSATLVKAALERTCGPVVITIGGCDYHDNTQTTGDAKDAEIGTHIARAILAAHALNQPFAFQVFTDGGISSNAGLRTWAGDSNDTSLAVFGVYDPAGPRTMQKIQVNRYNNGQGADRNHFLGSDPKRVAHAIFANYLAVNGQVGRYASIMANDQAIPSNLLDAMLLFPNG